jgi:hypothetical protein
MSAWLPTQPESNYQAVNFDQRFGTIFSVGAHLAILASCAFLLRCPISSQLVAAGEGQGSGESVIEVGVVEAGQLGLTPPRDVSFIGEEANKANNEVLETETPKPPDEAEVLPSTETEKVKQKEKVTDRPTANQTEQLVTQKPLRGSSANTNVEVGRSFGSPVPSMTSGVGVASGVNLGASGLPGGSEYGRRIQMILSRNYSPPAINDAGETQYVIVQLRIARDGRILSIVNNRVSVSYVKRRSSNDLINNAAERAILTSNPLPPFPNGFLMSAQEAVAEVWFRYPK